MSVKVVNAIILIFTLVVLCLFFIYYSVADSFRSKCEIQDQIIEGYKAQVESYEEVSRLYEEDLKLKENLIKEQDKLIELQEEYIKTLGGSIDAT